MADDRDGRDKQADDEEKRQRTRELAEARERADEPEPADERATEADQARPRPDDELGDLDEALDSHAFPTTTDELVAAHGDRVVESRDGWRSVGDVLAQVGDETFDSADDVLTRIRAQLDRD